jgi:hypothetical protein
MKNLVLEKFQLVQIMTDEGLLKKVKLDKKYEKELENIEKQFGRIMKGLEFLDQDETDADLKADAKQLLEIIEVDLPEAMGKWMRAYCNALYSSVKLGSSREEDE